MAALKSTLGFRRRIIYSAVGLIAGDFLMVILISLISRTSEHPPENLLRTLYFAVDCSLFGWVVVGIPAVMLINTAFVARLRWYFEVLVGTLLGFAALLIVFMVTMGHTLPAKSGGHAYFWVFAALVSIVAFSIYSALARQAMRQQERESAEATKDEPLQILRSLSRIDINDAAHEEKPRLVDPGISAESFQAEPSLESGSELPLDIYNSDWLNTLEPTDPRRLTSAGSRPPGSKPS